MEFNHFLQYGLLINAQLSEYGLQRRLVIEFQSKTNKYFETHNRAATANQDLIPNKETVSELLKKIRGKRAPLLNQFDTSKTTKTVDDFNSDNTQRTIMNITEFHFICIATLRGMGAEVNVIGVLEANNGFQFFYEVGAGGGTWVAVNGLNWDRKDKISSSLTAKGIAYVMKFLPNGTVEDITSEYFTGWL